MPTVNSEKFHIGDTPVLTLRYTNPDGSAADVSSAASQTATLTRPDGTTATINTTYTGAGTGVDGKVDVALDGTHLTMKGYYTLYGRVTKAGSLQYTSADYVFKVWTPGTPAS